MIYLTNILRAVFRPHKLWSRVVVNGQTYVTAPGETGTFTRNMACPFCRKPMTRSDRKEDWHVDHTGHAQYSCTNDQCSQKPRYRRVDVLETAHSAQDQSRAEKQAQEHESWLRLVAMENRLTLYLRDKYKGHFRGQFPDIAEIAIYIISGGKDGTVTNPLSGRDPQPDTKGE